MGVYIKGMEMPFCCLVCPCSGTDNTEDGNEVWICEASKLRQLTTEDKIEHRPEWCPLVPVPPHGRLIDADAISYDKIMLDGGDFYYGVTMPYIYRMTTIIPAELAEEE